MKNSKSLFEKKIELSDCHINGGKAGYTATCCWSTTGPGSGCDTNYHGADDNGNTLYNYTV